MRPGFYILGLLLVLASYGKASAAPPTCPDGAPVPLVTPGPPVAPVLLRDVQMIRIQSRVGFKAYDDLFERRDGIWVRRDDGFRVSSADLAAVLKAVSRPAATQFDFNRAFDRPRMLAGLNKAEAYLYEARSLPAARNAFETSFFDLPMFEQWIDKSWFDPCRLVTITDYYPHVDVTITSGKRRIEITSGSQKIFMLPLWITDERGTRPTYDPGLAEAIAKIMPPGASVKDILWNDDALMDWGYALAQSAPVEDAITKTGTTHAQALRIAKALGLSISYNLAGTVWTGAVWLPQMPRIRYSLKETLSSNEAFAASLHRAKSALQTVLKARWFVDAMRRTPSATAQVSEAGNWKDDVVQQLYLAERVRAGDCLAGDLLPGTVVDVSRANDTDHTRWFVLGNGDMVLHDFVAGSTVFHFGKKWYDSLPVLSTEYGTATTGVIVTRDGSLLSAQAPSC